MPQYEKLMCVLTWFLLIFPDFVLTKYCLQAWFHSSQNVLFLSPFGLFLFLLFQMTLGLSLTSHIRCWLADPGKTPFLSMDTPLCKVCNQFKPPRSHHCSVCQVCIHRMDHHCIWVNNCVGAFNQKYFILFLFYTAFSSLVAIFILICTFFQLYGAKIRGVDPISIMLVIFCALESILFLFFTGDFLLEQIESVKDNQTCVESYQFKRGCTESLDKNFVNVFGKNSWFWIFPVAPILEVDYEEGVILEEIPKGHGVKEE